MGAQGGPTHSPIAYARDLARLSSPRRQPLLNALDQVRQACLPMGKPEPPKAPKGRKRQAQRRLRDNPSVAQAVGLLLGGGPDRRGGGRGGRRSGGRRGGVVRLGRKADLPFPKAAEEDAGRRRLEAQQGEAAMAAQLASDAAREALHARAKAARARAHAAEAEAAAAAVEAEVAEKAAAEAAAAAATVAKAAPPTKLATDSAALVEQAVGASRERERRERRAAAAKSRGKGRGRGGGKGKGARVFVGRRHNPDDLASPPLLDDGRCLHRTCLPLDTHKAKFEPAHDALYNRSLRPRWQLQATKALPRVDPRVRTPPQAAPETSRIACSAFTASLAVVCCPTHLSARITHCPSSVQLTPR